MLNQTPEPSSDAMIGKVLKEAYSDEMVVKYFNQHGTFESVDPNKLLVEIARTVSMDIGGTINASIRLLNISSDFTTALEPKRVFDDLTAQGEGVPFVNEKVKGGLIPSLIKCGVTWEECKSFLKDASERTIEYFVASIQFNLPKEQALHNQIAEFLIEKATLKQLGFALPRLSEIDLETKEKAVTHLCEEGDVECPLKSRHFDL